MKQWNYNSIQSLKDKVIVVTGGNSGLGFESVKYFAKNDATVIMAARSIERATAARDSILEECPNCSIDIKHLDLADLSSVDDFVKEMKSSYDKIDILLNNAGIMVVPYGLTEDGFEKQFGVNHLGHFALTAKLFDMVSKGNDPRIVNISSLAHRIGNMDFHNLMYEQGAYSEARAYGRSKLANLLFTYELDRRIKQSDQNIKVFAAHPGSSRTNLVRHIEGKGFFKFFKWIFNLTSQDSFKGALPGIRACLDTEAVSGEYYGPSGVMQMKGHPIVVKSSSKSKNENDAIKLWEESERLTKTKFNI